ncbi:MAG: hypothetical protein K6G88_00035, partial [Lachnospiraceae bacterium]|nr:hypothetical protein [Lachnospiraceae bacterium]
EMLSYLDKKYNSTFMYLSYSNAFDGEFLDAYDENDPDRNTIHVQRMKGGKCKDDYEDIKLGYKFEEMFQKFFDEQGVKDSIKVYCTCTKFDKDSDDYISSCAVDSSIFINDDVNDEKYIDQLIQEMGNWLIKKKRNYAYSFFIYCQTGEQFETTSRKILNDPNSDISFERKISAMLNEDAKQINVSNSKY